MENLIIGFLAGLVIFGLLWQFVLKNKKDEDKVDDTELKIDLAKKETELKAAEDAKQDLINQLNEKKADIKELYKKVDEPLRKLNEKLNQRSGGQGRIVKGMMALMGLPCGASRPPSEPMDVNELNQLRDCLVSFGWPVQLTAEQAFDQTT